MNVAAVLLLDRGADLDLGTVERVLTDRVGSVPRLRQRLLPAPPGCGRPVWVDDAAFTVRRHLTTAACRAPAGERELWAMTAELVCARLPRDRPLWTARWIPGLADGRAALVLVVHHVLTDGIGGLAALAALTDEAAGRPARWSTRPAPGRADLARDAWRERLSTGRRLPGLARAGMAGLGELGLTSGRPSTAPATSLNRPTGTHRRLTTVARPLAGIVGTAHARRCTVNDLVLTATVGALAGVLGARGEHPDRLVVSVPTSARRTTSSDDLGNRTGVLPLAIPTLPDPHERLQRVADLTRARRSAPAGSSAAPLGLLFRLLGHLRLFTLFAERQRLVNTFVTNLRGPARPLSFDGHAISAVVPVAVTPGNVGVSFDVLSYAGMLVITVVADPGLLPEQDLLTDLLERELSALTDRALTDRASTDRASTDRASTDR